MQLQWQWQRQRPTYANFGNANQWTVNAGMASLAREATQNSNDASIAPGSAELVFTFIRLTGEHRRAFEEAIGWSSHLRPHVHAMRDAAGGAVSAGQLSAGLDALEDSSALLLLRISDYGCYGLTGPELADIDKSRFGNFIKLCRLDLYSGKSEASGGSFGLGKAVYWRFSRLQTALFNSTLRPEDAVDGQHRNRLFGVQQGVVHRYEGTAYEGRGYFGIPSPADGDVRSHWADDRTVRTLHLAREDERPGTSALVVGFYDPDEPEIGLSATEDLATSFASELRAGIEESFWPALTRGRIRVRIDIEENGERVASDIVDPRESFTELVHALESYDAGRLSDTLEDEGAVVARDITIRVPRRKDDEPHEAFDHTARLVVTLSDKIPDSLENRVCLFRQPEMIVETVDHTIEGQTYHAFLLAGAAKDPDNPSREDLRADDFLRFSEPPAHDRWIPRSGRKQISQSNLTARYVAPWKKNLQEIERSIRTALNSIFAAPLPSPDTPPKSVLRHLRHLRAGAGEGGTGTAAARKPVVIMESGRVEDGRWVVEFTVRAQNRPAGWSVRPVLTLAGLDGGRTEVDWLDELEILDGDGEVDGDVIVLRPKARARVVKCRLRGSSVEELPVPAAEAGVEVVLRGSTPAEVSA